MIEIRPGSVRRPPEVSEASSAAPPRRPDRARGRARSRRLIGALTVVILLGACASGTDGDAKEVSDARSERGESGLAAAGDPVRGGRLVYGLEAETPGGYCLPEMRNAISGTMVRGAIYDTLMVDNNRNERVPSLARSVTPNETYDEWTFEIREGITFHDGSDLDAQVVANNMLAWKGRYPTRHPTSSLFGLADMDTVEVTGPMTIVVTTKVPWVAFPRVWTQIGIMAQAQLDDTETCETRLIGTGPFKLASWVKDKELLAQRNPEYWQIAPDGKPYPYLDAIAFRPIPDTSQRISELEGGAIHAMMTAEPNDIAGSLTELRDRGVVNLLVSEEHAEVDFMMLNNSAAPFDDLRMRKAVAMGLDRGAFNELTNAGFPTIADQPFPPGDPGYLEDPGFPDHDPEQAKALVEEYKADGGDTGFTLAIRSDLQIAARGQAIQDQLAEVGIAVRLQSLDEAALIDQLIDGRYQATIFHYFAGGEPDEHYLLWTGGDGNPINFNRIKSPVIDQAFAEGRGEPDPNARRAIYERITRDFATNVWNVWLNYTPWAVALSQDVHGVYSVVLPDGHGTPAISLSRGHPLHGLWIEN